MIDENAVSTSSSVRRRRGWRAVLSRRLVITDLLVLVWVVFGVQIAWLGFDRSARDFAGGTADIAINYTVISVIIIIAWMLMLEVFGTRGYRVLGGGSDEYKLVATAALRLFGVLAIVAFLLKIDLARGYILIAFPLGVVVLIFSRWMWRQWLSVRRLRGEYLSKVLLVGSEQSVMAIARELERSPANGYSIVGVCLPHSAPRRFSDTSIRVLGTVDSTLEVLRSSNADTVVLTSADELSPRRVRELSWGLEPGKQHLVVAPSLVGVGGPRIHTRPVAGLPLIHVETPRYEGGKHFAKRTLDIIGSSGLLVMTSPLLIVIALLVKVSSKGPVLYRQQRVGLNGAPFNMLKFRSMRVGADDLLLELLKAQGTANQPLFKVAKDPRVTGIGRFLRKYSLDEFPQLINVLRGEMSLVGPRPQREGEVALYDDVAHRRLLLKPGMSGLWQVSGRSTLSWEDSIRLDLYYVENWSLMGDLGILWKTVRAVIAPGDQAH